MVLIDLVYALKLTYKQMALFTWILLTVKSVLLKANLTLLRENFKLLTLNVALLKFMDCVLDFQIRIYSHTHYFSYNDHNAKFILY